MGSANVLVAGQKPKETNSCEYASRVTASAPDRRCAAADETGDREVERVPEEMDGARLAAVPARELLEDLVSPLEVRQSARPRPGRSRHVRDRPGTVSHRHPKRGLADRNVDFQVARGAWSWPSKSETESPSRSANGSSSPRSVCDHQVMVDEVEGDLEAIPLACMRRLVSPRTSIYRGTCHQWFRGRPRSCRIFPTICAQRCSVSFVSAHPASGSSGSPGASSPSRSRARVQRSRRLAPLGSTMKPTSSRKHQLQSSPGSAERTIGWLCLAPVPACMPVGKGVAAADLPRRSCTSADAATGCRSASTPRIPRSTAGNAVT